ncbi:MAG: hypothetical protein WBN66_08610 [Smithella sp.]
MNKGRNEREWQELQSRINKFVGRFLKNDIPAIEHKTSVSALLPSPPQHNEDNVKGGMSPKIWAKYYQR